MKILIANYRYFVSSGPERYLFQIKRKLEDAGHEIAPFSIRYTRNEATPYEKYFVSPLGTGDEVYFDQHKRSPAAFLKTLSRLFYASDVERAIGNLADDFRPDIAYILYYLRKLSPSVLTSLKKRSVPIVVRLSDYGMFCPEHHCLRDGQPCTLCIGGNLSNSIKHRCVKGSAMISALDAAATFYHRMRGYFDLIDQFVTTNVFMTEMMIKAGYPADRLTCIPTFTDTERFTPPASRPLDPSYIVFVGRLDPPKGVHVLLDAMVHLKQICVQPPVLRIAGVEHNSGYLAALKGQVSAVGLQGLVEFLGPLSSDKVADLMRGAVALINPALWFENLPNTIIESFACGTPVIASNIGSLRGAIIEGENGFLSKAGDAADLAQKIARLARDPTLREKMSRAARRTAETVYSPDDHLESLERLFHRVIEAKRVDEPLSRPRKLNVSS
jgi:glycosyltransferase involved in cell wall biosynthesis